MTTSFSLELVSSEILFKWNTDEMQKYMAIQWARNIYLTLLQIQYDTEVDRKDSVNCLYLCKLKLDFDFVSI